MAVNARKVVAVACSSAMAGAVWLGVASSASPAMPRPAAPKRTGHEEADGGSGPIAVIHVSGALNATYKVLATTPQGCQAGWKTDSNQVLLWVRRYAHKWPELSVTKFHPGAPTHGINLRKSRALSVDFMGPRQEEWIAGRFFFVTASHAANYGSGTVTTNKSMTTGTLKAKLVWSTIGPKVRPIHVSAHWDCPPNDG